MASLLISVNETTWNTDQQKPELIVTVAVVPMSGDTFTGRRLNSYVIIQPSDMGNAQQIATAIKAKVKADVLAEMGLTIQDVNIHTV